MAAIAITQNSLGATTLTRTVLSLSDTLAYVPGLNQTLYLANNTGAAITATLIGSLAPAVYVIPNTGGAVMTPAPSAGKAIVVPANGTIEVTLDDFQLYLQGSITVTSTAIGLIATVLSN